MMEKEKMEKEKMEKKMEKTGTGWRAGAAAPRQGRPSVAVCRG